jgi:hypothetical protein
MPESINDPLLGHLEWDDKLYWWVGEIDLRPSHRIEVFIDYELEEGAEAEVLAKAHQGLERLRQRELDYREWTANHLIDRRWNKDEPMTVQDLVELLEVASIQFFPDGRARIYWNDDDVLFGGHNVTTNINARGECVSAGME